MVKLLIIVKLKPPPYPPDVQNSPSVTGSLCLFEGYEVRWGGALAMVKGRR